MPLLPKIGSLESIVLAHLILKGSEGITINDFKWHPELSDDKVLEQTIINLNNGMFESEDDEQLKFDA